MVEPRRSQTPSRASMAAQSGSRLSGQSPSDRTVVPASAPRNAGHLCRRENPPPDLGVPPSGSPDAPRPADARRADLSSAWRAGDPGGTGCADGTRHGARPAAPPAPRVLGAVASASPSMAPGTAHRRRGQPLHSYAPGRHRMDRRAGWACAPGLPARSMRRGSTRSNSGSVSSNANASSGPAPRPTLRWLIASPALGVSGITLPGPFAGPSKAILSSDKWVPNLWDSALDDVRGLIGRRLSHPTPRKCSRPPTAAR